MASNPNAAAANTPNSQTAGPWDALRNLKTPAFNGDSKIAKKFTGDAQKETTKAAAQANKTEAKFRAADQAATSAREKVDDLTARSQAAEARFSAQTTKVDELNDALKKQKGEFKEIKSENRFAKYAAKQVGQTFEIIKAGGDVLGKALKSFVKKIVAKLPLPDLGKIVTGFKEAFRSSETIAQETWNSKQKAASETWGDEKNKNRREKAKERVAASDKAKAELAEARKNLKEKIGGLEKNSEARSELSKRKAELSEAIDSQKKILAEATNERKEIKKEKNKAKNALESAEKARVKAEKKYATAEFKNQASIKKVEEASKKLERLKDLARFAESLGTTSIKEIHRELQHSLEALKGRREDYALALESMGADAKKVAAGLKKWDKANGPAMESIQGKIDLLYFYAKETKSGSLKKAEKARVKANKNADELPEPGATGSNYMHFFGAEEDDEDKKKRAKTASAEAV